MPWITTCPTCELPIENGFEPSLETQPAAPRASGSSEQLWIDIALSSDEPVKVALLRHFLTERQFAFEESRRFVSIRAEDAARLASAIELWAFHHDLPDDDRHLDTLQSTLREIGDAVLTALHVAHHSALPRVVAPPAFDLR
jgi:hypothetical protein